MLGSLGGRCDEGQVDVGGGGCGQLLLRLLSRFLQSLEGHLIIGQIHALCLLKLRNHPVGNRIVKIVAAQMGIAVGGQNLDDAVADLNDGNIKGTAAQVVHHDLLLFLIVQAVGQSRSRGLVDNTLYLQARDLARILGGLALGVIEIRRNRDNRLGYRLAQIALCIRLQLLQNHSGNLLGRVLLAVDIHLVVRAHVALNRGDGPIRIGHCLALCRLADEALSVLSKRNDGRCGPHTLCIGDNGWLSAFHNGHAAIGST